MFPNFLSGQRHYRRRSGTIKRSWSSIGQIKVTDAAVQPISLVCCLNWRGDPNPHRVADLGYTKKIKGQKMAHRYSTAIKLAARRDLSRAHQRLRQHPARYYRFGL